MVFLDFRCNGQGQWKKNEVWNEKKMKFEETQNEKNMKKKKNKWKINENKNMI